MTTMAHDLARSRRFLCEADVDLIMEAVRTLPMDRVVYVADLGAGSGTTALSVFSERPHLVRVVTVDHDQVALDSTRECMTNAGHILNWHGVWGKTSETRVAIAGIPYDMLMVDANHEYEAVKADLAAWLPLVRKGAPVWCHDYTDEYPGCMQAIDEAVMDGRIVGVKSAGLGWLGRKGGA